MSKIKNALISLSDKEKLKSVLEVLKKNKVNIIAVSEHPMYRVESYQKNI